ncbi:MAG: hypothetical protein U5Q03_11745 [Bacteroidota bacterium]|nr:hypothetical protein [Bacteroidota bacterium]
MAALREIIIFFSQRRRDAIFYIFLCDFAALREKIFLAASREIIIFFSQRGKDAIYTRLFLRGLAALREIIIFLAKAQRRYLYKIISLRLCVKKYS